MPSADKVYKQFGLRSGPTKCLTWIQSVSHSDAIPEIIFAKKNDFEKKISRRQKRKHAKLSRGLGWGKELTYTFFYSVRENNMCEVTFKACLRSYLVGWRSKALSDPSSTSIPCACAMRRLWLDCIMPMLAGAITAR